MMSKVSTVWIKFRCLKRWQQWVVVLVLLAAVGSVLPGEDTSPKVVSALPGVEGERLDVAKKELGDAGMAEDAVEVVGGGAFGVVAESSWTVCEQSPTPGTETATVRLVVDRSCGGTSATETTTETTSSTPRMDAACADSYRDWEAAMAALRSNPSTVTADHAARLTELHEKWCS